MTVENYPPLLDKAAQATGEVRDRINGVLSTLAASLAARGEPWGNDKLGKQFAEGDQGYVKSKENLEKSAGNMAISFGNFSKTQTDAARELRKMERGNGDQYTV
ncbi:hypothetical protein IU449_16645 [Nocardia higoensis]|uniref:WXG100 family type VII secretion target n=1 Tax=Nocardia higoensis TaxID=228599 RepID=A0ABS0DCH7_9NOCA|nr:hypothetical protein [Nocardia higoensis]MBF6356149.1 hypothetical protein [Nocardia higoensis]